MYDDIFCLLFNNSDMPRIKKAVPMKYMVDTFIQYNVDVSLWKSKIKQKINNEKTKIMNFSNASI